MVSPFRLMLCPSIEEDEFFQLHCVLSVVVLIYLPSHPKSIHRSLTLANRIKIPHPPTSELLFPGRSRRSCVVLLCRLVMVRARMISVVVCLSFAAPRIIHDHTIDHCRRRRRHRPCPFARLCARRATAARYVDQRLYVQRNVYWASST